MSRCGEERRTARDEVYFSASGSFAQSANVASQARQISPNIDRYDGREYTVPHKEDRVRKAAEPTISCCPLKPQSQKILSSNFLRKCVVVATVLLVLGFIGLWAIGWLLTKPAQKQIGAAPSALGAENISFPSESGAEIKGWFARGEPQKGVIILMHGVRGNRQEMLGRAELFHKAGYSVLLFDFQAHGESIGKQITLGWLESRDAQAAVKFVKEKCPGEKIGVVGVSLGGVAAVLADPRLAVDAYVLELVYSNVEDAISNRIKIVLGPMGGIFTPFLSWQIKPRLGISTDQLRPEHVVHDIPQPKLFLAGAQDKHSTIEQSRRLFQAAAEPKELVVFEGANHQDLYWGINTDLYKRSVLQFLEKHLRQ